MPVTAWDQLVAAAIIGTERRPELALEVLAQLPPPAAPIAGEWSPEQRLLGASAWLAAQRRAAWRPQRAPEPVPPAPGETAPEASRTAAQILALLLTGAAPVLGREELVSDWLACCAAGGKRVPHGVVRAVLERALRVGMDADTWQAVGERGRWLAQLAPERDRLVPASGDPARLERAWAQGTVAQRRDALMELRRIDPESAREILVQAWPSEAARARLELLAAVDVGLGDHDEPFLEDALDDRAGAVRQEAARLLDRLPGSRRAQRMAARALPLVSRTSGGRLEVRLPPHPDAAALRDGAGLGPATGRAAKPSLGGGANAALLRFHQLVRATPLALWAGHLGMTPSEAVEAAYLDQAPLLAGWAGAAVAQQDVTWARALVSIAGRKAGRVFPGVAQVAGDATTAAAVIECLKTDKQVAGSPSAWAPVAELLKALPRPWSVDVSEAVVSACRSAKPAARLEPSLSGPFLVDMAVSLAPAVAAQVESWALSLPEGSPARRGVEQVHNTLALRRTIVEELR